MAKKADTGNVITTRKMGRPVFPWTDAVEEYIIAGVIAGQSLRQIEQNGRKEHGEAKFPCAATVKNYLASNQEFLARYAKAKDIAQDLMAEDLVAIVDGTAEGFAEADLDQRKASAEIRKWIMGKLRRKKWGEVKTTEVTGKDGAPLIQPQIIDTRSMTPEAQMALYDALQLVAAQNDAEDAEYTEEEPK